MRKLSLGLLFATTLLLAASRYHRPRILHVEVGNDDWEASIDELKGVRDLFVHAGLDSIGAVVCTRPGVWPRWV